MSSKLEQAAAKLEGERQVTGGAIMNDNCKCNLANRLLRILEYPYHPITTGEGFVRHSPMCGRDVTAPFMGNADRSMSQSIRLSALEFPNERSR